MHLLDDFEFRNLILVETCTESGVYIKSLCQIVLLCILMFAYIFDYLRLINVNYKLLVIASKSVYIVRKINNLNRQ